MGFVGSLTPVRFFFGLSIIWFNYPMLGLVACCEEEDNLFVGGFVLCKFGSFKGYLFEFLEVFDV